MARTYYTQQLDHSSDAGFRAWASAVSAALAAIGLTKTADTGQVADWATVTRPGISTEVYEVWQFTDALQATAPIYLKVWYGTTSTATTAKLRIQLATGTNGAGVLTGIIGTTSIGQAGAGGTPTQAWPTYACFKNGTFTLAWQAGWTTWHFFIVDRARDNNGVATGRGVFTYYAGNNGWVVNHVDFLSTVVTGISAATVPNIQPYIGCITPPQSSSASGALVNLYNWFYFGPDLVPLVGLLTYKSSEIAPFAEFDVAMVGGTARHYLTLGVGGGQLVASASGSTSDRVAMLWEV